MTNEELINRLRDVPCWAIGTEDEETMLAAADRIEEQQVDLRKANEIIAEGVKASRKSRAALETAEKLIAEMNTKCADLQSQINSMENEIEELSQNEGGWISNYDGFDYDVRCSVCGEEALIKEGGSHDHAYSRYCPNCGARMKGEQE